jgi:hypothetical protein
MSWNEHAVSTVNRSSLATCRHFCGRRVFQIPKQAGAFRAPAFAVAMAAIGVQVAARPRRQRRVTLWIDEQKMRGWSMIDQPALQPMGDLVMSAVGIISQMIQLSCAKAQRTTGMAGRAL